jgi:hypothetical protein
MPTISRFFGLAIRIHPKDHAPPHFHVYHSGGEVMVDIETGAILKGSLSARARGLVARWAALHKRELIENWDRAQRRELPKPIAPLEQERP